MSKNPVAISDEVVQGSPLAAVNDGSQIVIFYQRAEGDLRAYVEPLDGTSIQKDGTTITTNTGSPIAAIVVPHRLGPKINAYYLDKDFFLTEFPDFLGHGKADRVLVTPDQDSANTDQYPVQANPNAGLAAVVYTLDAKLRVGVPPVGIPVDSTIVLPPILHITVFYQDFTTDTIYGLTWNGFTNKWGDPKPVPVDPLVGTALAAAVSVKQNEATIRLYYQAKDIKLQESIFDGNDWSAGKFHTGDIALQGPLATTSVTEKETILVYYRELPGKSYVGRESQDSDSGVGAVTTKITKYSKYRHTAVQVGETLRFYYQDETGNLFYRFSTLDGKNWKNKLADEDPDADSET